MKHAKPQKKSFKSIRLVLPYFVENRAYIIFGLISLVIVDLAQLYVPRIVKQAVDDLAMFESDVQKLFLYATQIIGLAVVIGVFRFFWRHCLVGMSRRIEEGLRNQLFGYLQTLSATYFGNITTGDLMAHGTNDIKHIRMATGMGMVALADGIIMGAAALGFMVYINLQLTILVFIPMPFIIFGTKFYSKQIHGHFQKVQAGFSALTEVVREQFAGIRIVKAYTREKTSTHMIDKISREYVDINFKMMRITGAFFPMMILFSNISLAIVLFMGGRQTILGTISAGDFVAFIAYLGMLTWPMMAVGWVTNLVQRGKASLDRLNIIFETQPDIRDNPGAKPVSRFEREISLKNVGFTYETKDDKIPPMPALSHITLNLALGKTLGIVGPPGSGKTTLVNLIPRLYDVSSGCIQINNTNIRDIEVNSLRSLISFVPQEPFLFAGTVRDNITFGTEVNSEDLSRVLDQSVLTETIKSFPNGLETIVGEKGIVLSGGQKQRVALARALLKPSPVLILDDPVSQVDLETGNRIIQTIRNMAETRTLIIVSHRISALMFADQIITMDKGKIIESGTHDQLLASKSYYAHTHQLQAMEEELNK